MTMSTFEDLVSGTACSPHAGFVVSIGLVLFAPGLTSTAVLGWLRRPDRWMRTPRREPWSCEMVSPTPVGKEKPTTSRSIETFSWSSRSTTATIWPALSSWTPATAFTSILDMMVTRLVVPIATAASLCKARAWYMRAKAGGVGPWEKEVALTFGLPEWSERGMPRSATSTLRSMRQKSGGASDFLTMESPL